MFEEILEIFDNTVAKQWYLASVAPKLGNYDVGRWFNVWHNPKMFNGSVCPFHGIVKIAKEGGEFPALDGIERIANTSFWGRMESAGNHLLTCGLKVAYDHTIKKHSKHYK